MEGSYETEGLSDGVLSKMRAYGRTSGSTVVGMRIQKNAYGTYATAVMVQATRPDLASTSLVGDASVSQA